MYKFVALASVAAASPVSVSLDADLRGGSLRNVEGHWSHSFQGINVAAEYDRGEHQGFLHKLRAGRNVVSNDGTSLDADVTYNFATKGLGLDCRAEVQGVHLRAEHDFGDSSTALEARYNVADTDLTAEFSTGGLDAVEAAHDMDVSGNNLHINPRFEMASKVLKSKLKYGLGNKNAVGAEVSYGTEDQAMTATASYHQELDNGDHLTVNMDPQANEVSATLDSKLGGGDSDPTWELKAAADYSKGADMMDSLSLSAKRSWSF